MENRQFVKIFIHVLVFIGWLILNSSHVAAYDIETHAALTQEIGKFYNQNFPDKKLIESEIQILMEGSRREDESPRWMNHFYDPVNERGLNFGGITWNSSKNWAQNKQAQISVLYNPVAINSTYAAVMSVVNPDILETTDYTWNRAIKDYVLGNKERAFSGLGHILHLIEDATVPAHTRDDPHPHKEILGHDLGDPDPYENWTSQFTPSNINLDSLFLNKDPIIHLINLNSFFEEVARYTNKHFYSQDRIGIAWYPEPTTDTAESVIIGDFRYGMGWDGENFYKLVKQPKVASALGGTKTTVTLKDDLILQDYWSRLSVKAVQYGAGVVNLFFQEVEKAKNDPQFAKNESISLVAQVIGAVQNTVSKVTNLFKSQEDTNLKQVQEIVVKDSEDNKEEMLFEAEKAIGKRQQTAAEFKNQLDDEYDRLSELALKENKSDKSDKTDKSNDLNKTNLTNIIPAVSSGGGGGSSGGSSASSNTSTSTTSTSTTESATSSTSSITQVVISEIYPDKTSNNYDFVEFYNPATSSVDLSTYSLRILKEGATSSESLAVFSGESIIQIPAKGFFLVGFDEYTSSSFKQADVFRSSKFLPSTQSAKVMLQNNDSVVDEFQYNPADLSSGNSFERKAYSSNSCVSAQNNGEFLGNGCDTDSSGDFETRSTSTPQNSASLPEPRDAPTAIANFTVGYHFSIPTLVMNWSSSTDYSGATSTISYEIQELNTPTSSVAFIFNSTSTALEQTIDEISRSYEFSIKAVDSDELASTSTIASTTVPSFVDNLYFYHDPRASSTNYLAEFYYNQYPFVPDPYWNTPSSTWKIIVFYLNAEADKEELLNTAGGWRPSNTSSTIAVQFNQCAGGTSFSPSLILPDVADQCGVGGGLINNAMVFSNLEDKHLIVKFSSTTNDIIFSSSTDYINLAFYAFYDSGGGNQSLKLVAVDKGKYFFQETVPIHQSPGVPTNLTVDSFTINSPTSTVTLSWDPATDVDTLDNLITYEWSFDGSSSQPLVLISGSNPLKYYANILLGLGTTSTISLRSVDDFSATSTAATTTLVLPLSVTDLTPHSSNSYFAVDEAKVSGGQLKIKWRLISDPASSGVFGIIPFLTEVGAPTSTTIDGARALHRDYSGNIIYSNTTANSAGQCNANITPFNQYTLGWQYETRFSSLSGLVVSNDLVGDEIKFALYATDVFSTGCSPSGVVDSPLFTGLPIVISN